MKFKTRISVLDQLIELIEMEAGFSSPAQTQTQQFDFWSYLHPDVIQHSKSRYDAGHYADSVEAAFKHVNTKVKDLVYRKTGKEHDGASLMRTAFSPNGPIVSLDDLSTESGRNIQQGYRKETKQLFGSGARKQKENRLWPFVVPFSMPSVSQRVSTQRGFVRLFTAQRWRKSAVKGH